MFLSELDLSKRADRKTLAAWVDWETLNVLPARRAPSREELPPAVLAGLDLGDAGLDWPPEHPGPYCESLRRMRDLPVQYVHGGHYGRFEAARMRELIAQQLAELC